MGLDKKVVLIIFSILLFYPFYQVNAAVCPPDSVSQLKSIASNINYDYSYVENSNNVVFSVRFTNVNPKIYIYDVMNDRIYYGNNQLEVVIDNLNPGVQYKFVLKSSSKASSSNRKEVSMLDKNGNTYTHIYDFGSNNSECFDLDILNQYITLPSYNKYHKSPLCEGIETYKLCAKWISNNISEKEFEILITNYKKSLENKKNIIDDKNTNSFIEQLIIIFRRFGLFIIIGIIIVCIAGTYIVIIRNKKNRFNGW